MENQILKERIAALEAQVQEQQQVIDYIKNTFEILSFYAGDSGAYADKARKILNFIGEDVEFPEPKSLNS